jgi:lysozyme
MAKQKRKAKKSKKKTSGGKIAIWLFIIFVFLGIVWYFFPSSTTKKINKNTFVNQIPKGFESFGIDISHHQGKIDWKVLLDDEKFDTIIQFVYCKATEGNSHLDTKWEENRKILNNKGIPNGAYHFFTPKDTPLPQAEHFLNHWKKREVDLPPVLDVETEGISDEDLRNKMEVWLKEVEKKSGMRPIIYTSYHFFDTKFKDYFKEYKFWIAAYSRKPECIDDNRILHWQYSESGSLPGIDELVDFNVSKIAFK